ncbi:Uncharacterised protein [Streptococcus pneumoniae]|nr:Uncharacterised protein [Streptococcus pneumoniae]CIV97974.1 Uncharacterised protein [Streptococcus pneumoniae]CIW00815.1 Uncharacterised protein [Streptococcus pneumoniae]CJG02496.1 Uncharacterised protein [Streptococcus pneumoniae]COI04777.1 Uncharacterised protein [Streptococcus pneumoniae]
MQVRNNSQEMLVEAIDLFLEITYLILRIHAQSHLGIQVHHPTGHPLDFQNRCNNSPSVDVGHQEGNQKGGQQGIGKKLETDLLCFLL